MLNSCDFIGHLGADPAIRCTNDGREIANFTLGVTEKWKGKDGEKKEKTEWVRFVVFSEGLVKIVKNYLKKGSKIYVNGKLQTRKWQDKDGNDKYTTEIVLQGFNSKIILLDSKKQDDNNEPQHNPATESFIDSQMDDSIPF